MNLITREEFHDEYKKMLKECTDVFDKIGISYSLAYGTLLGAYRNNDIISWDHDIDLYVKYINPEQLKLLREHLPSNYYIESYEDNLHICFLTRICNKELFIKSDIGLENAWIDLFETHFIKNSKKNTIIAEKMKHYYKRSSFIYRKKGKNWFFTFLRSFINIFMPTFKQMNKKIKKLYKKAESGTDVLGGYSLYGGKFRPAFCFDSKIKLGGHEYKCMSCAADYLSNVYGKDFMTPKKYDFQEKLSFYRTEIIENKL